MRDPDFAGLQVVDDLFGVGALELWFVHQVGATQLVESFRVWLRLVVGQEAALVDQTVAVLLVAGTLVYAHNGHLDYLVDFVSA